MIVAQFFWHVIAPPHLRDILVLAGIGKSLIMAGCEHQWLAPAQIWISRQCQMLPIRNCS